MKSEMKKIQTVRKDPSFFRADLFYVDFFDNFRKLYELYPRAAAMQISALDHFVLQLKNTYIWLSDNVYELETRNQIEEMFEAIEDSIEREYSQHLALPIVVIYDPYSVFKLAENIYRLMKDSVSHLELPRRSTKRMADALEEWAQGK